MWRSALIALVAVIPVVLFSLLASQYGEFFLADPSLLSPLMFAGEYIIAIALLTFFAAISFAALVEMVRKRQLDFYLTKNKYVLLEVKLLETAEYSISSMESFFENIYTTSGEKKWKDRFIEGKTRPVFSFEIVGEKGQVRFFIRCRESQSEFVSGALYTNYPDVQITEYQDYVHDLNIENEDLRVITWDWALEKANIFPIRTFIDSGLHTAKAIKDGSGIDPMSPLLEVAGSMRAGERFWLQIIIRGNKEDIRKKKDDPTSLDFWKKQSLSQGIEGEVKSISEKQKKEDDKDLSQETKKRLQSFALRAAQKANYDLGMRLVYTAPKEDFRESLGASFENMFRLTNSVENKFKKEDDVTVDGKKPEGILEKTLKSLKKAKDKKKAKEMIQLYKMRLFWIAPAHGAKTSVVSSEELATICHLPSALIKVPGIQRKEAQINEPPANLPV